MSDDTDMIEQSARRYCSYCSKNVLAGRRVPADAVIDPIVVFGTLGLALLLRKSGPGSQREPFRCPQCGKPVGARAIAETRHGRKDEGPSETMRTVPSREEKTAVFGEPGTRENNPATPAPAWAGQPQEYVRRLVALGRESHNTQQTYQQRIRPGILLYYGEPATAQVDKLVAANNIERALKLLSVARPYRFPRARRFAKYLAIPVLMDLAALGFIVVGAVQLAETGASREWPTVEGMVLSSGVDTVDTDDGLEYRAVVRYRYQVQEIKYVNNRVSFGWATTNPNEAHKVAAGYQPGSHTTVYYKRDNPARSVLLPGYSATAAVLVAMGVFMTIASGVSIALLSRKPLKELREIDAQLRTAAS